MLVFWETTRACGLSCLHCRASAIPDPLPGELTPDEGLRLIDQVAEFGSPPPLIVFTGGDPLRRPDLPELLSRARARGITTAVSPAVTELLTDSALRRLIDVGVTSLSLSLDGASAATHDGIRRVHGTYARTVSVVRSALDLGLKLQINTAVLRPNVNELARIFHDLRAWGVPTWEVFFLVQVGRATEELDLRPEEYESVTNFLYDASRYGVVVRTVEAPFVRRVLRLREISPYWDAPLYQSLAAELIEHDGPPTGLSTLRRRGTLDGDGIVFVAHDGTVQPGGLLPVRLGNVRTDSIVELYRGSELLRRIRTRDFSGPCGTSCPDRPACGGSRARAHARRSDPLASDPACLFIEGGLPGSAP
ncbi:radical SAM domain-containing protein [mine drainage metagenome]|uniref:Radical SAM domain-containing protein n=2 Tax=mine drainage metagenome TaxID=410659 RepID=T0ZY67_9ZZZZ